VISDQEIDRAIERVRAGKDRSTGGKIDPQDRKEAEADIVAGRDRDPSRWRAVMERFGFTWSEAQQLNATIGPQSAHANLPGAPELYWHRPHKEGQWRSAKYKMAFTLRDLAANFETPERFATWIEQKDMQRRAAAAGIVLPRTPR